MSENILKEICKKVLNLFKQTETEEVNAKDVACNRLRVVLMQDRTNLTPELLQRMRRELVELLSKYVEMDKEALELNFDQEGDQMALMLSIPVIRAKDEEEIEKALKEEDEKKNSDDSEVSEEIEENENESEIALEDEESNNEDFGNEESSPDINDEQPNDNNDSKNNSDEIGIIEDESNEKGN